MSRRLAAVTAVAVASLAVLVAAILHTGSVGAVQVAQNAKQLHWANATMGAAGIVRASLAQAVFFSVDMELGIATADASADALDEATTNLDSFDTVANGDTALRPIGLVPAVDSFSSTAHDVIDRLEISQASAADRIRTTEVEPAFTELSRLLETRQAEMVAAIDETETSAGRTGVIAQASVTLLIPAAVMLVYWWLARDRMRRHEIEFEARLEKERDLSRAKDTFIAGVSHELRTPLTSIYGLSEILVGDDEVDRAAVTEYLNLINVEAGEMSRMVEDLLTSSRLEAGALSVQIESVDLSQALEQVVAPLRRNGLAVHVQCEDFQVEADPLRIRQVIRNLVSNAQRHGGPEVIIRATQAGGWARLEVVDNGEGVPPAIEERMFERFVNDGRRALLAGSVGLGLAVAQALVEHMGGAVDYTRAGQWTVFTVSLRCSVERRGVDLELVEAAVS